MVSEVVAEDFMVPEVTGTARGECSRERRLFDSNQINQPSDATRAKGNVPGAPEMRL